MTVRHSIHQLDDDQVMHQVIDVSDTFHGITRTTTARTRCGIKGSIAYSRLDSMQSVGLTAWTCDVTCAECLAYYPTIACR